MNSDRPRRLTFTGVDVADMRRASSQVEEQLLRESRAAASDFRDLSRSLKQNPSQLLYESRDRGVEVAK